MPSYDVIVIVKYPTVEQSNIITSIRPGVRQYFMGGYTKRIQSKLESNIRNGAIMASRLAGRPVEEVCDENRQEPADVSDRGNGMLLFYSNSGATT